MVNTKKFSFILGIWFMLAGISSTLFGDHSNAGKFLFVSVIFFSVWFVRWTSAGQELAQSFRMSAPRAVAVSVGSGTSYARTGPSIWESGWNWTKNSLFPFLYKHWKGVWVAISAVGLMISWLSSGDIGPWSFSLLLSVLTFFGAWEPVVKAWGEALAGKSGKIPCLTTWFVSSVATLLFLYYGLSWAGSMVLLLVLAVPTIIAVGSFWGLVFCFFSPVVNWMAGIFKK